VKRAGRIGAQNPGAATSSSKMKTTDKFVRVYDFDTKEVTTIPAAELAPGMVQARIQGMEGIYWVNTGSLGELQPGPYQHPPFKGESRAQIIGIMNRLKEVYPLTLKLWEEGFRRDLLAQHEIAKWVNLSECYADLTEQHSLTASHRKSLFRVLLACMSTTHQHVWEILDQGDLANDVVTAAVEEFYGQPTLKNEFANLKPEDFADTEGNVPIPVTKVEEPDVRENLKNADVVLGVDCFTGDPAVFFGGDRLKKIIATGTSEPLTAIRVLYDSRTDQLELLYLTVKGLKGSCCYGTGK
jgi:hypothetical protein